MHPQSIKKIIMKKAKTFIATAITTIIFSSCTTSNMLTGKTFDITELNGTTITSRDDNAAFITFNEGDLNTSVGCNRIFAPYKAMKDGTIIISEGGATKMLCPDELREDEYLAALHKVKRYVVNGKTVSFLDADGKVLFKATQK